MEAMPPAVEVQSQPADGQESPSPWRSLPIEIVGRNMDVKSDSGKGSEGNEKLRSEILCHLREWTEFR